MADEVRMKNQGKEKPMGDLISRQAVLDLFKEYQPHMAVKTYEFGERLKALEPAPTIEASPCDFCQYDGCGNPCIVCPATAKE